MKGRLSRLRSGFLAVVIALPLPLPLTLGAQSPASDAEARRALHALNRLTFGPRPGDVERVLAIGVDRWIDMQLQPGISLDAVTDSLLGAFPAWRGSVAEAVAKYTAPVVWYYPPPPGPQGSPVMPVRTLNVTPGGPSVAARDSIARLRDSATTAPAAARVWILEENSRLMAGRLARMELAEAQLLEVMTDFWSNHFSLWSARLPSRGVLIDWDRSAIRPNALGQFRSLLAAVVKHPAMLTYLDNAVSSRDSLNENFGRELLELHTLGADGGYTQQDVVAAARIFTGWTHSSVTQGRVVPASRPPVFQFRPQSHDTAAKSFLGHAFPAGRGIQEGEELLDILARHPSTARHIARKLAVRFVSDEPPSVLVDRAAATFLRTDGDIAEVVRTIVTSPEFFAPEARRAKVKAPVELILSMRRALAAPVDTSAQIIDLLIALEQPPFGKQTPEGWSEVGGPWIGAGAMHTRLSLAGRIAAGTETSIPVDRWPEWRRLLSAPFDDQLDGVVRELLGGEASSATREALRDARPTDPSGGTTRDRAQTLRDLIAIALASPDFQRR